MLKKNERVTINGECVIDDKVVCVFTAIIEKDNPEKMIINTVKKDEEAYKANRFVCREDFAEFEDYAYSRQAELMI